MSPRTRITQNLNWSEAHLIRENWCRLVGKNILQVIDPVSISAPQRLCARKPRLHQPIIPIARRLRFRLNRPTVGRMPEGQFPGVEHEWAIRPRRAIEGIPGNRTPGMEAMQADLVCSPS